ncbi:MAG: hypothetical protein ACK4QP_01130 [Pseudorhizobium sp.]
MIGTVWRNALYYFLLLMRHPLYALLPAAAVLLVGSYAITKLPRHFYSEGVLVTELQQIPSSLVSPTVANDRLRFIDQRVMSRANLASLAERLNVYPDLSPSTPAAVIAAAMRSNITLRQIATDSSDGSTSGASVIIGFKHALPSKTVDVTTALIEMIIEENRRLRQARASETTRFLQREVDDLSARLSSREAEWARLLQENEGAQPNRLPTMLIDLQAREEELVAVQQALSAGEAELTLLETQLRVGLEAVGPAGQLKIKLERLKAEIADKGLLYTPQHPQMRLLRQKSIDLTNASHAAEEVDSTLQPATLPADLALLVERLNQAKPRQEALETRFALVQERASKLKDKIAQTSQAEKGLAAVEVERQTLLRTLDDMKARLATAMMGERLEQKEAGLHVEVLERPVLPSSPSGPRKLILLTALALAAVGAAGLGLILFDLADRRVRGAFDLQGSLDGYTVVMVPLWVPPKLVKGWFGRQHRLGGV